MIFDQNWLSELFELQKKTAELAKGSSAIDEVQDLVMTVLNKWGINNLPWDNGFRSHGWSSVKDNAETGSGRYMDIDVSETKQYVKIRILIPGLESPEDLSIKLVNNALYVSSQRNTLDNGEEPINRKIRLPSIVTAVGAAATYHDSYLSVSLPKMITECSEAIPIRFS